MQFLTYLTSPVDVVFQYRGEHTLIATTTGSSFGEGQSASATPATNNEESKLCQDIFKPVDQQPAQLQRVLLSRYYDQRREIQVCLKSVTLVNFNFLMKNITEIRKDLLL